MNWMSINELLSGGAENYEYVMRQEKSLFKL